MSMMDINIEVFILDVVKSVKDFNKFDSKDNIVNDTKDNITKIIVKNDDDESDVQNNIKMWLMMTKDQILC